MLMPQCLDIETVKKEFAKQETQVQFLDQEDPLEKEMATHSSSPAWRIPWTEEFGRLQSMGSEELDMTWQLNHHRPPPPESRGKDLGEESQAYWTG